jgi:enamine deaminase RidA (YjgF/YER057c/UK114 family)
VSVEETLQSLGHPLPTAAKPVASYVPAVRSGNLVFTSGQLPTREGTLPYHGSVASDVGEDAAYEAARLACLNALAAVKTVIGDLDKIVRIVRLTGYVNSDLGFTNQPVVVNGASDLLRDVFGKAGEHARSAVGVYELPLDSPVEIELVVEVRD